MDALRLLAALVFTATPLLAQSTEELEQCRKRFPEADTNRDGTLTTAGGPFFDQTTDTVGANEAGPLK